MRRRLALALLAAASCRAKAPDRAPCSTVAARFDHVARAGLGSGTDDALRRGAEAELAGIRIRLEQLCTDGKWSPEARDCIVAADDRVALEACERKLTDEQRAALDK